MRSVVLDILLACVAQPYANGLAVNSTSDPQDSIDKLADKLAKKLVDRMRNFTSQLVVDRLVDKSLEGLFGRTLKATYLQHTDVDSTTLGKPCHSAIPVGGRLYHRIPVRSTPSAKAPLPIESDKFPSTHASLQHSPLASELPLTRRQFITVRSRAVGKDSLHVAASSSNEASRQRLSSAKARRQLLSGGLVALALIGTQPSVASFGSARGGVTSQPKLTFDVNVDNFEALDPRKQAQVQSLLRPSQVDQLLDELGLQKQALRARIELFRQTTEKRFAKVTALREKRDALLQRILTIQAELLMMGDNLPQGSDEEQKKQVLENELRESLAQQKSLDELLEEQSSDLKYLTEESQAQAAALAELDRKQELEARLTKRATTLAALDSQPAWFNYVAAFVASLVSTSIMHPLDTLKTREVADTAKATAPKEREKAKATTPKDKKKVEKANALWNFSPAEYLSLYQGIQGALLKEGPPSAAYLGVYEAVKTKLLATPTFAQWPLVVYLISGALGETVGSVIRAPAEQLKSRVQSGLDSSTSEAFQRVILDQDGRQNVLRSWSASLWRDVPFGAVQLAVFEGLKSFIINSPQSFLDIDVNTLSSEVLFGATGGLIGSFVSVPMDVVTTRIMTQAVDAELLGFVGMTKKIVAEGGPGALMTGWRARTGYWAPAIGIFLSCYCGIRQAAIGSNLFPGA